MSAALRCPECGAGWSSDVTCTAHFHQMSYWELEDLPARGRVHHLMVLTYNLQHPSIYSPQTLQDAMHMLVDFLDNDVSSQEMRRRMRDKVDSGKRQHKITGTPESHGEYAHPVQWTMRAADVITAGVDRYCESVEAWAKSALDSLRASGNLP